jgi:hypothetical protein
MIEKSSLYENNNVLNIAIKHMNIICNPQILKELQILGRYTDNPNIGNINTLFQSKLTKLKSENFIETIDQIAIILRQLTGYNETQFKSNLPVLWLLLKNEFYTNRTNEIFDEQKSYYEKYLIYSKLRIIYILPQLLNSNFDIDQMIEKLYKSLSLSNCNLDNETKYIMNVFSSLYDSNRKEYMKYNTRLECMVNMNNPYVMKVIASIIEKVIPDYKTYLPILNEIINSVNVIPYDYKNTTKTFKAYLDLLKIIINDCHDFKYEFTQEEYDLILNEFDIHNDNNVNIINSTLSYKFKNIPVKIQYNSDVFKNTKNIEWYAGTIADVLQVFDFDIEQFPTLFACYKKLDYDLEIDF